MIFLKGTKSAEQLIFAEINEIKCFFSPLGYLEQESNQFFKDFNKKMYMSLPTCAI